MTFDEFNSKCNELAMTYGRLIRWNREIRDERDEARKMAEEYRDQTCLEHSRLADDFRLPWEVGK